MKITHSNVALTNRVDFDDAELMFLVERTGGAIANLIAEKWVADNYQKLIEDPKFVEKMTKAAIKAAGDIFAENIRMQLCMEPQIHAQVMIKPEMPNG
jgi:hypothetical protein